MYAFIHIPRTAGSTVRWMLYSTFGIRHVNIEPWGNRPSDVHKWMFPVTPQDLRRIQRIHPFSLRSIAGHLIRPFADLEEVRPDIQYYTFLRDPISYFVSLYRFNVSRGWKHGKLPFEEFVSKHVDNPQTIRICGEPDAEKAIQLIREKNIFVGLTEHFDESILLLKTLLMPELNLGYRRMNVLSTQQIPANQLSDDSSKQLVMEKSQADQEVYSFVTQELFNEYRAAYGPSLTTDVLQYQNNRGDFNRFNIIMCRAYRFLVGRPAQKAYRWMNSFNGKPI